MEAAPARTIRIGLLGCGNVGRALVPLIARQADAIEARTGLRLQITRIAVRDVARDRGLTLADGVLTDDPADVATDPNVDIVVELIGGAEPAKTLIDAALRAGKPVVTGNKALLANSGADLFAVADQCGVDLLFEAAVAGGIPFVRPLRESLRGEPITRVMGILNGTTNFILTKMTEEGTDYAAALAEAQQLGYAEADPTADVEGFDAGAKAAIIASIAFGTRVEASDVYHEGISAITPTDIAVARRLGYVVKLLGIAECQPPVGGAGPASVTVRVHPAMVPVQHPLASVREAYNAVFVEGDAVGSLMFYGRGAGGDPTASAVLGDVIDAAVNLSKKTHGTLGAFTPAHLTGIDDTCAEYLIGLEVADQPGVLHQVTGAFADYGVSIRVAEQEGFGDEARLVFITHTAREAEVQATVRALRELPTVRRVSSLIRVIGA